LHAPFCPLPDVLSPNCEPDRFLSAAPDDEAPGQACRRRW
jgi:hypothetical protein